MQDVLLAVAATAAFLAAFLTLLWVRIDSERQGIYAQSMVHFTLATMAAILSIPGFLLALNRLTSWPEAFWERDQNVTIVLTVLGLMAGVAALFVFIAYTLRWGVTGTVDPGFGAGAAGYQETWEVASGAQGAEPVFSPDVGTDVMALEPALAGASSDPAAAAPATVILKRGPTHLAWVVMLKGARAGHETALGDDTMIGTDGNLCQIVLEDAAVSKLHARIRHAKGTFTVHDLGSTNGTWVNGEEITKRELSDKDRLVLGETEMVFLEVKQP